MNRWLWRLGVAAGLGAAAAGLRRLGGAARLPHPPRPTDDLFPDRLTIMGHRGAAAVAPENTMVGFGVAARLGLPFELDVRLCQTGEVVVIHDETLERTTGHPSRVDETPWSVIRGLDAGAHFGPAFAGLRVPALDTVLATLGGEVVIDIELKAPGPGRSAQPLVKRVVELVNAHEASSRVVLTSFDPQVLALARAAAPDVRRGQIVGPPKQRPLYEQVSLRNLWFTLDAQPDLLIVERTLAAPRYVRRLKQQGFRVFAWTVNEEAHVRLLIDAGVDGLITDDPARLLERVGRDPPAEDRA